MVLGLVHARDEVARDCPRALDVHDADNPAHVGPDLSERRFELAPSQPPRSTIPHFRAGRGCRGGEFALVQARVVRHHAREAEAALGNATRRPRMAARRRLIVEVAEHRVGERFAVARRNEHPGHPGLDQLGISAHPGRNDRKPARHRLENRIRHPFRQRGQDEAVQAAHDLRDVGTLAGEPDPFANPGAIQQSARLFAQSAVPNQDESKLLRRSGLVARAPGRTRAPD